MAPGPGVAPRKGHEHRSFFRLSGGAASRRPGRLPADPPKLRCTGLSCWRIFARFLPVRGTRLGPRLACRGAIANRVPLSGTLFLRGNPLFLRIPPPPTGSPSFPSGPLLPPTHLSPRPAPLPATPSGPHTTVHPGAVCPGAAPAPAARGLGLGDLGRRPGRLQGAQRSRRGAGAAGRESEGDGASQLGGWVASAAWLLACRQACRHARWPLPEARPRFPLRAAGEPGIKGVASSGPLPGRRSSLLRRGGSSPAPGFLPERVGSSCALPPSLSALVAYARCHHTGGSPLPDAPTTSLLSLLLSLSATAPPASPRHVVTAQAYAKGAPPPVGLNGAPAPRLAEARLKVGADERELF